MERGRLWRPYQNGQTAGAAEQAGTGSTEDYPVLAEALTSAKHNAAAVAHLLITAGALVGHQSSLQPI